MQTRQAVIQYCFSFKDVYEDFYTLDIMHGIII